MSIKKVSSKEKQVAYFSMEFAIENKIKTYAGGLGILAGDYIKGAVEYDFPIVGIGIKWKQGYNEQHIEESGMQFDAYHNYEYDCLKDTKVTVKVRIREEDVYCKVWQVTKYGVNNKLFLLDTDIPENGNRWITGHLYGWFGEERIAQEMVLGIGGIRALRALGIKTDIYHFNEGHAVFAGLELIREKMEKGDKFEKALDKTKSEVVFTTHTPIIQGNESHPLSRIMYMNANNGLTLENLVHIGGAPFNMTVAGLNLAKKSNAVAQLHAETANKMWAKVKKSDIIGITNAIHLKTWVDDNILNNVKDAKKLWENHQKNKKGLIEFVEKRNGVRLNLDKLLIGFSRRAVEYKRSDLIFQNITKLEKHLKDGTLQIVFSGKAHPLDDGGKEIVKTIVNYSKKYKNSVVFLANYDMEIGAWLTRGSDVWLNNPRRPLEASGTSGMKAAMNGVLNCSILDGWWPEACKHGENGWQFGNGKSVDDFKTLDLLDKHDLEGLQNVLLNEVIPTYYKNKDKWVKMMQSSITTTKDFFNVKRMLEEYTERLYNAK